MAGAITQGVSASSARPRFSFRLAEAADDAELRRLLRETPMDGPVRVTLRREPSYFAAAAIEGPHHQTLVATDSRDGRIVGMGSRSIRRRYVDGRPAPVGYLSALRILPRRRGGLLLARGYREIRRLHEDGAADYYLTTIADGNSRAIEALTGGRADLPTYFPLGKYHTLVLPLRRRRAVHPEADLEIRPLRVRELPQLIAFLRNNGRSRLFFPCYAEEDFRGPQATFKNLALDDILTAWRGSRLVASLALWDQSAFKQTVVEGYRPAVRMARPAYNAVARCFGWPRFPAAGERMQALVAAVPMAAPGEEWAFERLLAVAGDHARRRFPRCRSLLVGVFEKDPLLDLCMQASLYRYVTQVFLVYWEEEIVRPRRFTRRDLYLELGCL